MPSLWHRQHAQKLWACLAHGVSPDLLGHNIRMALEAIQLEVGIATPILEANFKLYGCLATKSWLKGLWCSCFETKLGVAFPPHTMVVRCQGDSFLIEQFSKFGFKGSELRKLNICRLSLESVLLSDLATGDGTSITDWAWKGDGFAFSTLSNQKSARYISRTIIPAAQSHSNCQEPLRRIRSLTLIEHCTNFSPHGH